jgi:hypothetical protein
MFQKPRQRSFYMNSACHFYLKNYTEIFRIVYKGNVPSFQYKTRLDRSTSMVEVDGLSLIFIDLYVLVLTLCLHCSEAALQLSENTASLDICFVYTCTITYIHD